MKYDFDKVIERSGTNSFKWDLCEKTFPGRCLLPMWVADMDFAAPPQVIKAVQERAAHRIYGYTHKPDSYFTAVKKWQKKRFNWEIQSDWIVYTPGIVPALHLAVQAFSQPGDKIIIQPPVYYPFMWAIENNGRHLINNTMQIKNGRYSMDLNGLKRSIDNRTRMLILCSPHNPVGRVWSREELQKLARICVQNNIIILSDEIHGDLIFPGHQHTPTATLSSRIADLTITCTAPSKTFNLAGLGTANTIISNPRLREQFSNAVANAGLGMANMFGIAALEAAYTQGEEWLEQLLVYLQKNYAVLCDFFKRNLPEVKVYPLEGTYLAWADFSGLGLTDADLKERFQKKGGVWLDDGPMFGPGGAGFQRINLACPRRILEEGLKRIYTALVD